MAFEKSVIVLYGTQSRGSTYGIGSVVQQDGQKSWGGGIAIANMDEVELSYLVDTTYV